MKKLLLSAVLFTLSSTAFASMSYECWRYVGGKPQGYVSVSANSNSDAKNKAYDKFRDLDKKVEYVKCK